MRELRREGACSSSSILPGSDAGCKKRIEVIVIDDDDEDDEEKVEVGEDYYKQEDGKKGEEHDETNRRSLPDQKDSCPTPSVPPPPSSAEADEPRTKSIHRHVPRQTKQLSKPPRPRIEKADIVEGNMCV